MEEEQMVMVALMGAEDTLIDRAHDWTHTAEFEKRLAGSSERYRMMVREVADLL